MSTNSEFWWGTGQSSSSYLSFKLNTPHNFVARCASYFKVHQFESKAVSLSSNTNKAVATNSIIAPARPHHFTKRGGLCP